MDGRLTGTKQQLASVMVVSHGEAVLRVRTIPWALPKWIGMVSGGAAAGVQDGLSTLSGQCRHARSARTRRCGAVKNTVGAGDMDGKNDQCGNLIGEYDNRDV